MEEEKIYEIIKSNNFDNITLAYITFVESGIISFFQFYIMLFEKVNKRDLWEVRRYYQKKTVITKTYTSTQTITCPVTKLNLNSHNSEVKIYMKNNLNYRIKKINKDDIRKELEKTFTPDSLYGRKKGIVKFFQFLIALEFIEKNSKDIKEEFDEWIYKKK